jgi:hypothetical protein
VAIAVIAVATAAVATATKQPVSGFTQAEAFSNGLRFFYPIPASRFDGTTSAAPAGASPRNPE